MANQVTEVMIEIDKVDEHQPVDVEKEGFVLSKVSFGFVQCHRKTEPRK